jgi:hypothetical protein
MYIQKLSSTAAILAVQAVYRYSLTGGPANNDFCPWLSNKTDLGERNCQYLGLQLGEP